MNKIYSGFSAVLIGMASSIIVSAAPSKAPAVTPAILEKGKASYAMNCIVCHGEKGDGNGVAGAAMNPKPRNFITDKYKQGDKVDAVFKTISDGMKGTSMAGFGHLPEADRWALAHYILSFKPKK